MSVVQNFIFTLLALLAGTSFVVQQAVNSNLRAEIGSAWWAGFVSYLGGALVMLLMVVVMREPGLHLSLVARSSWWSWTGGVFGAIYIATSILLLPRLGAFAVITLLVVGQLVASLVFDHFAILHVPHYPITFPRLLGGALLLAGAILIRW
ncbi:MAG: DMT family transporter [Deltaproteobacteria bacterium]|nr:DMT family transporter [Deltaproteobacteria bacterium]